MARTIGRFQSAGAAGALCALALLLCVASDALASAPPEWQLSSSHSPPNIPIFAPVAQVDSVVVTGGGATPYTGRLRLLVEDEEGESGETRLMSYAASAASMQAALEAVERIGHGNVRVTGGPRKSGGAGQSSWTYVVTFTGALKGRQVSMEGEGEQPTEAEESTAESGGAAAEEGAAEVNVLTPGSLDTIAYTLTATNIGGSPSSGRITLTDTLPPGLSTMATPEGKGWICAPPGEGRSSVTCTSEAVVQPGAHSAPLTIEARLDVALVRSGEELVNTATISGGGAPAPAQTADPAVAGGPPPPRPVRPPLSAAAGPSLSPAAVAALLFARLTPSGRAARIAVVLRRGGFTVLFKAPDARALETGAAVIDWYAAPSGSARAGARKARPLLVAAGRLSFSGAASARLRIRLTRAGASLLSRSRRVRLTSIGTFTPHGGAMMSARRTFLLSR